MTCYGDVGINVKKNERRGLASTTPACRPFWQEGGATSTWAGNSAALEEGGEALTGRAGRHAARHHRLACRRQRLPAFTRLVGARLSRAALWQPGVMSGSLETGDEPWRAAPAPNAALSQQA